MICIYHLFCHANFANEDGLLSWKRLVNQNTFCVTAKIVENKKEVIFDGEPSLSYFRKYP